MGHAGSGTCTILAHRVDSNGAEGGGGEPTERLKRGGVDGVHQWRVSGKEKKTGDGGA